MRCEKGRARSRKIAVSNALMKIARQLLLFFVFGCTQFAVDTLLLLLLTQAHLPVVVANPLSRACAAVLGLLLNFTITFRRGAARAIDAPTVLRYVTVWVSITLASTALVALLYRLRPEGVADASWLAAVKIAVEGVLFLVSFFLARTWIYRVPSIR